MPVHPCPDGSYRIGSGPCQYDSKEKAERAYRGYLAEVNKGSEMSADESSARADNLVGLDGEPPIYHRSGGRWRSERIAKSWVPVQRYSMKLSNGSKLNPLGEAMKRAGMDNVSQEALIDRVTNMGLPSRVVKLGPRENLYASQARVEVGKVNRIALVGGSPPILLKVGDRTVVIDGHHRIAKARARNATIEVVLYDANLLDVAVSKHLKGRGDHDQKKHGRKGGKDSGRQDFSNYKTGAALMAGGFALAATAIGFAPATVATLAFGTGLAMVANERFDWGVDAVDMNAPKNQRGVRRDTKGNLTGLARPFGKASALSAYLSDRKGYLEWIVEGDDNPLFEAATAEVLDASPMDTALYRGFNLADIKPEVLKAGVTFNTGISSFNTDQAAAAKQARGNGPRGLFRTVGPVKAVMRDGEALAAGSWKITNVSKLDSGVVYDIKQLAGKGDKGGEGGEDKGREDA